MPWDDPYPLTPDLTVFEPDLPPIPTGLFDAAGRMIVRLPRRAPIGFVRFADTQPRYAVDPTEPPAKHA